MHRQKKKIVNRKNYILYVGAVLSFFVLLVTLFGPFFEPYNPTKMELSQKFIAPCREFIFGTDHLGRDIFSRVIEGARVSLVIAGCVVLFSAVLGVVLGDDLRLYGRRRGYADHAGSGWRFWRFRRLFLLWPCQP